MGVEPYESNAILLPIYNKIGKQISAEVGCPVKIYIATSYNAEIEAMRAGKLEMGQFGPLGYVLAHQVADAQAVATVADAHGNPSTYTASIATWPGSGITTLAQVKGHTFAYSDPASTSGHLFPAYALQMAGIDPNKGVIPLYSGSHTASYETLLNHKVEAGEMNSQVIQAATLAGNYNPKNFVVLWQSKPIPLDPMTVYGKLNPVLKAKITAAVQNLKLTSLTPAEQKVLGTPSGELVPTTDAAYDQIRSLVHVLHINLSKLS
ncbi:MAG TPA: phosphate/phosphite/phosphonate ABC transporter substrate-binding protein, partial [Acidocella sp.]|nr:phosphate/phosphite/phosphonate ABC transporter substrate-binding protein [Acidocella sp.]